MFVRSAILSKLKPLETQFPLLCFVWTQYDWYPESSNEHCFILRTFHLTYLRAYTENANWQPVFLWREEINLFLFCTLSLSIYYRNQIINTFYMLLYYTKSLHISSNINIFRLILNPQIIKILPIMTAYILIIIRESMRFG